MRCHDCGRRTEPGDRVRGYCRNCYDRRRDREELSVRDDFSIVRAYPLPGDWVEQAVCAQTYPEEFFPKQGASSAAAKKICFTCPVRTECLDYAMACEAVDVRRFGVWGGLTANERRQLARQSGEEIAA